MKNIKNILKSWLPLAIVTTGLCGLVYLTAQQVLRMNANDPQIQMTEDTAAALEAGSSPADLLPERQVDIATSLAPFLVIYNDQGIPQISNGRLNGELPELPAGVFGYVKENGEDRITWQPEAGVRVAAVVVLYTGEESGYVMAGRSLREVEKRVDQLGMIAVVAWLAILIASFLIVAFLEIVISNKRI
jgi:hypothetical protein